MSHRLVVRQMSFACLWREARPRVPRSPYLFSLPSTIFYVSNCLYSCGLGQSRDEIVFSDITESIISGMREISIASVDPEIFQLNANAAVAMGRRWAEDEFAWRSLFLCVFAGRCRITRTSTRLLVLTRVVSNAIRLHVAKANIIQGPHRHCVWCETTSALPSPHVHASRFVPLVWCA